MTNFTLLYFQVIKYVNSSIPGSLVLLLLNSDSAIMKLRFCADEEVQDISID